MHQSEDLVLLWERYMINGELIMSFWNLVVVQGRLQHLIWTVAPFSFDALCTWVFFCFFLSWCEHADSDMRVSENAAFGEYRFLPNIFR